MTLGIAPAAFWKLALYEWRAALEAVPLRAGARPGWLEREQRAGFARFKRDLEAAGRG